MLEDFKGTWRRFSLLGNAVGTKALVYDDYAHHPTAIKKTLAAAKDMYLTKKIRVVFQPHLYSRTKDFFEDFTKSFTDADEVIFTDIYGSREEPDPEVTSEKLAEASKETHPFVRYGGDLDAAYQMAKEGLDDDYVVFVIGAGDVDTIAQRLVESESDQGSKRNTKQSTAGGARGIEIDGDLENGYEPVYITPPPEREGGSDDDDETHHSPAITPPPPR